MGEHERGAWWACPPTKQMTYVQWSQSSTSTLSAGCAHTGVKPQHVQDEPAREVKMDHSRPPPDRQKLTFNALV